MGRSRGKKRVRKGESSDTAEAPQPGVDRHSVSKLLDKAEELLSETKFDLAEKFCKRALEKSPNDERSLTTLGVLYVEWDKVERARETFEGAIRLHPENGHTKFLYLAQMSAGVDALDLFSKAARIVEGELERRKDCLPGAVQEDEIGEEDLCSIWCASAELFLTDLCDETDAASKCESYLQKAVALCPENAEALQTYGSFLISANRNEEAKQMLERSVSVWLPKLQELASDESGATAEVECPLNFDARKSCAKLLIEVELFEMASDVLDTLLAEADDDVEIWYLHGWNAYLQGAAHHARAKAYLTHAQEVAKKCGTCEGELVAHIEELLKALGDVDEENDSDEEEGMESDEENVLMDE